MVSAGIVGYAPPSTARFCRMRLRSMLTRLLPPLFTFLFIFAALPFTPTPPPSLAQVRLKRNVSTAARPH